MNSEAVLENLPCGVRGCMLSKEPQKGGMPTKSSLTATSSANEDAGSSSRRCRCLHERVWMHAALLHPQCHTGATLAKGWQQGGLRSIHALYIWYIR